MANSESIFFFGVPCMTTSTIFPESREACLTSSSMSKRFAATTSPSAPPAGVDPVQPIASTCSGRRIGSSNSPCAVPRVQPRQSWYFSACTFSRPMAFILAAPHSSAFRSEGDPVTRAPMSSLSSVRYWKACESIIPSPAILTSDGFVPSSSGPFGIGRLSARAINAPLKEHPSATTATPANARRIRFLLALFAQTNSITHSDGARRHSVSSSELLSLLESFFLCVLCVKFFAFVPGARLTHSCISGNQPVAISLRTSIPALNCLRGHLATSFQLPSAFARARTIFSSCFRDSLFLPGAASSAKVSREAKREGHDPHGTSKPHSNRASRNPLPLRSQWRQPQRSSHPRAHQQRTRRPPIRSPQPRLQPLLSIHRNPSRPHHPSEWRHRRHPSQRHQRQSQSRRRQRPRLPGRPHKIRPHPRPRARRHPRIPRHHHHHASPPRPRLLARPLLRPLRRRLPGNLRTRLAGPSEPNHDNGAFPSWCL